MSWQITVTLWAFSVIIYVFVGLLFIAIVKRAMVEGMKEVVGFYLAEKSKWIEQLEQKFGNGRVGAFRN